MLTTMQDRNGGQWTVRLVLNWTETVVSIREVIVYESQYEIFRGTLSQVKSLGLNFKK